MFDVDDVSNKIKNGKALLIAGDEELLKKLPEGSWIGGTIPYFIGEQGGLMTKEKLYVTELPSYIEDLSIIMHDEASLKNVFIEEPEKTFSFIIIPASSSTHLSFAINGPNYEGFATRPLIGWISGILLDDLGKITPKIINGITREIRDDGAILMHIKIPDTKYAEINIVNIFEQGTGDIISFEDNGFSVKEAIINGIKQNFAEYIKEKGINTQLPLVANYSGAMINISFQSVDEDIKTVNFYAPVFKGIEYKHAKEIQDYVSLFRSQMPQEGDTIIFSCNCILNYLYSELEGKKTGEITGPITFGEIAYQLLNQTMVYLTIKDY